MMMNIGKTIRILRTICDLQQAELAEKIKADPSYISLLERNKRTPSLKTLEEIAAALGVQADFIMFLSSDLESVSVEEVYLVGSKIIDLLRIKKAEEPLSIEDIRSNLFFHNHRRYSRP